MLCAVHALVVLRAGEATSHLVPIQVFRRQMDVVRTIHTGPESITQQETKTNTYSQSQQRRKGKWSKESGLGETRTTEKQGVTRKSHRGRPRRAPAAMQPAELLAAVVDVVVVIPWPRFLRWLPGY